MKAFKEQVAVVTGAASGIGRGLAQRCAEEGMRVVLADIQEKALEQAKVELMAEGADVLAVRTDVSQAGEVEALARKTLDAYGAVHLLFNNAGVFTVRRSWENSVADWQWVIGVNLWGVINGIRAFVPIMLEQEGDCHVVNTASGAGLIGGARYNGTYSVTKHGVVALSETLYHELAEMGPRVGVSVFCPGAVQSGFLSAERSRPAALKNDSAQASERPGMDQAYEAFRQRSRATIKSGITPEQAAAIVFDALQQDAFYILTDPRFKVPIQMRMEDILLGREPTDVHGPEAKPRALAALLKTILPIPRWRYLKR
jgi:NAD(P)-dependent dehydrogenase (short-subunit alcohol dehydrogenase family)